MPAPETHATPALVEADRLMTICNACRYCEGLCAVFPAMEMRRSFPDGDLNYLANLCHGCGACYVDCQFADPHEFNVNVPLTLAKVRADSYRANAWPRALAPLFARNGLAVASIAAAGVALFIAGFVGWHDPRVLFARHVGPGAFYRLMPHNAMAALFGAVFLYAIVAMAIGVRQFWRAIGSPPATPVAGRGEGTADTGLAAPPTPGPSPRVGGEALAARAPRNSGTRASGDVGPSPRAGGGAARDLAQATKDAGTLRYLDGGGVGCFNADERPTDRRRLFHHLTFYGFALCFASTSVATLYHYILHREAPYPWYDLPVVLGTLGGIGLLLGPVGLFIARRRRDPALVDDAQNAMVAAFLAMLFATSLTGLALLVLRATPAMGVLLAIHLGVVFALFLTMPYGTFVHGLYRFAALLRYARERRTSGM